MEDFEVGVIEIDPEIIGQDLDDIDPFAEFTDVEEEPVDDGGILIITYFLLLLSVLYNTSLTCSHHLMVRIQDFHSWHTSSILVENTREIIAKEKYL